MTRLELAFLGPPRISRDGSPVAALLQKPRALLIYLAMEAGREHARESLVGLFWPDQPEAAARTNLRQALANLREAIGDSAAEPPFLSVDRDTIRLDLSGRDRLDVQRFLDLLEACRRHPHRIGDRCRSCANRRQKAVALYRGDFLSGFHLKEAGPFEEWAAIQRERLHRQMVDSLGRLAIFHEAAGDLGMAEEFVARQLGLDPWMEEAHRERIRLLAQTGRRSEALSQFETCRRVLGEELGVEPSQETLRLVADIRQGALEPRAHRPGASTPLASFAPGTRFLGRETELEELIDLLEDPAHRLITITGAGGMGKSRLALEAAVASAMSFRDGVVAVPLAGLDSPDLIPAEILQGLAVGSPGPELRRQLLEVLRDRQMLLVFDGLEHLLPDGRELLGDLLQNAPGLTLLVTSQERLGLQAEWRFDLAGLDLPAGNDEAAADSGAVRLFFERARQVNHRLKMEAESLAGAIRVCRAVEGVPLAIELAASAAGVKTVGQIATGLEADVRSLESRYLDVPERHRTQAAAFDYSWGLLDPASREALRRLSVFRGGWDQAAAAAIADADPRTLETLTDKSLIRRDTAGRYDFHPLLRLYAGDRLRAERDERSVRQAHLEVYASLAADAAEGLGGEAQMEALARLDRELANLRGALAWSLETGQGEAAAGLCLSLSRFWMIRGLLKEGQSWVEQVLGLDPPPSPGTHIRLLNRAGILAAMQRRFDQAESWLTASVDLSRRLGDRLGEVTSLNSLGAMSIERQQFEAARRYLEACLPAWDELGNLNGLASSLNNLGVVALMAGAFEAARGRFDEALLLFRQLGDRRMIAGVLHNLGDLQIKAGRTSLARDSLRESLELRSDLGEVGAIAESLEGLAAVAVETERAREAARLYGAASAMREAVDAPIAPVNQDDYDRFVTRARLVLGEQGFDRAWEEGRGLSVLQASALARSI